MLISELITMIVFVLNDVDHVAYPESHLIGAINHGCRMTAVVRPDVSVVIEPVTLIQGVQQALPAGRLRLLEPCYLLDDDDTLLAPVELVLRSDLDRLDPGWVQQTPSTDVNELMLDERFPRTFWVNPPAEAGVRLQLCMATMPPLALAVTDEFPLTDKYVPPVMEWVLYLMFSRDSERSQNQQRAVDHRNQFYQMLQVKTQADVQASPARPGSDG